MARARAQLLYATTLLLVGCGSDPEPSSTTLEDASTLRDVSSEVSTPAKDTGVSTTDRTDDTPRLDGSTPDVSTKDGDSGLSLSPTDAASEDGPTNAEAALDSDAAFADAPITADATSDTANAADGPVDAASEVAQSADAPSDATIVTDGPVDAASEVAPIGDAASDHADDACTADACAPSGFPGSALVDSAQGAMINGWIGAPTQLWKICYSTALHARSGVTFHANCDFKGPSVSIARVSYSSETRVIGGYNSGSWFSPVALTFANNSGSFLFSVTNAFKHAFPGSSTVPDYTLNNANYGPTFGAGVDWYVHSQLTMGTCRPGYTYQCRTGVLDSAACNVDFCGTPSGDDYYVLDALEVWIH